MKAVVYRRYGPPEMLQLEEVPAPVPRDNEVLVRVRAATVTAGDCEIRRFQIPWLFWLPLRLHMGFMHPKARILGQELAGDVEAVGKDVQRFRKGDAVYAITGMNMGGYAQYICLSQDRGIAMKPENIRYEEAATLPVGGLNALYFLRKAGLAKGEKILINGAGGCIGTFGVQIAKLRGAEVTAVDSAEKLGMLRAIGADHVVDYTKEDFTRGSERYDVIFEVAGKTPPSRSIKSLSPKGRYVSANPSLLLMFRSLWSRLTGAGGIMTGLASEKEEDFAALNLLIKEGKIRTVIDKQYPLSEIAEAHRYVDDGYKTGTIAITIS